MTFACHPRRDGILRENPKTSIYKIIEIAKISALGGYSPEKIHIFSTLAGICPTNKFNKAESHFLHFLTGSLLPQLSEVDGKFIIHSAYSSSGTELIEKLLVWSF